MVCGQPDPIQSAGGAGSPGTGAALTSNVEAAIADILIMLLMERLVLVTIVVVLVL